MKNIIKLSIAVAVICALAGAGMVFVYNQTKAPIAKAEKDAQIAKMKMVLPNETAETHYILTTDENVVFFSAVSLDQKVIGYAAISGSKGFGGDVRIIVGLTPEGKITGIIVDKHNETPGVGSNVVERKQIISLWDQLSGSAEILDFPPNTYLDQYKGMGIETEFEASKNVNCVSGATISSKAVLNAVNQISQCWCANKNTLCAHCGAEMTQE